MYWLEDPLSIVPSRPVSSQTEKQQFLHLPTATPLQRFTLRIMAQHYQKCFLDAKWRQQMRKQQHFSSYIEIFHAKLIREDPENSCSVLTIYAESPLSTLKNIQNLEFKEALNVMIQIGSSLIALQLNYGSFLLTDQMIFFMKEKKWKIWINSNIILSHPQFTIDNKFWSQFSMIKNLVEVILKHTTQTEVTKCFFNELRKTKTSQEIYSLINFYQTMCEQNVKKMIDQNHFQKRCSFNEKDNSIFQRNLSGYLSYSQFSERKISNSYISFEKSHESFLRNLTKNDQSTLKISFSYGSDSLNSKLQFYEGNSQEKNTSFKKLDMKISEDTMAASKDKFNCFHSFNQRIIKEQKDLDDLNSLSSAKIQVPSNKFENTLIRTSEFKEQKDKKLSQQIEAFGSPTKLKKTILDLNNIKSALSLHSISPTSSEEDKKRSDIINERLKKNNWRTNLSHLFNEDRYLQKSINVGVEARSDRFADVKLEMLEALNNNLSLSVFEYEVDSVFY